MKNINRLLIVIVILIVTIEVDAQTYKVKAGLNLSECKFTDAGDEGVTMRSGFNIGFTADYPLKNRFSIETGLLLTSKGYKEEANVLASEVDLEIQLPAENFTQKTDFLIYYLEIPVTLKASFDIGETKIYGAFGPYVAYGLRENNSIENYYNDEVHKTKFNYSKGRRTVNRFDYGLVFGLGLDYGSVLLGLSYDMGLTNLFSDSDSDSNVSVRALGLSVGYIIN